MERDDMSKAHDEIIELGDKTALVCDEGPAGDSVRDTLEELGFKCHEAETGDDAIERMKYTGYDVVAIGENFAGSTLTSNPVIRYLATLPMAQRRHSYVFIVGDSFRTLDAMQAYSHSVHLVVNAADTANLGAILKKGLSEFDLFYRVYQDILSELGEIA